MVSKFKEFLHREEGAVTAEIVVITSGVIALGLAVLLTMADGVLDTAAGHNAHLENQADVTYPNRAD